MALKCGIVGLPNVGKSTLFNALTSSSNAEAANYPFCTIEPNVGRVAVPDERLDKLAKIANSAEVIPTILEFVDIAGLVAGASKGEGLGNQFLGNIRETDAIVHVVRCFEDDDITHVSGSVDPLRDIEIIETELILADLESLEKRIPNLEKKARGNKENQAELEIVKEIIKLLSDGKLARYYPTTEENEKIVKQLQLLTTKKILYVCNIDDDSLAEGNEYSKQVAEYAKVHEAISVNISVAIEAEIAGLESQEEKQEFLNDLGLSETGLDRLIKASYELLGLITFFTVGPKEAHAWTVAKGALAPKAAGVIHTDFEHGFIRAETISYQDYIECQGEKLARETGKLRQEGKEYVTSDGDVFHFKFNV